VSLTELVIEDATVAEISFFGRRRKGKVMKTRRAFPFFLCASGVISIAGAVNAQSRSVPNGLLKDRFSGWHAQSVECAGRAQRRRRFGSPTALQPFRAYHAGYPKHRRRYALPAHSISLLVQQPTKTNTAAEVRRKIDRLTSSDPVERATIACELGKMRERAVIAIPSLVAMLADATEIGLIPCRTGDPWDRETEAAWKKMKTSPGKEAAESLIDIGRPAVEPLLGAMKDSNWKVRLNAVCALGFLKDPRAVGALSGELLDENPQVREAATEALERVQGKRR
jgi:HEAT repeat protein